MFKKFDAPAQGDGPPLFTVQDALKDKVEFVIVKLTKPAFMQHSKKYSVDYFYANGQVWAKKSKSDGLEDLGEMKVRGRYFNRMINTLSNKNGTMLCLAPVEGEGDRGPWFDWEDASDRQMTEAEKLFSNMGDAPF